MKTRLRPLPQNVTFGTTRYHVNNWARCHVRHYATMRDHRLTMAGERPFGVAIPMGKGGVA